MGCFLNDLQQNSFSRCFLHWKRVAADQTSLMSLELSRDTEAEKFNAEWTAKWEEEVERRERAEDDLADARSNFNASLQKMRSDAVAADSPSPHKDGGWSKLRRKKSVGLNFAQFDQVEGGTPSPSMALSRRASSVSSVGSTIRSPPCPQCLQCGVLVPWSVPRSTKIKLRGKRSRREKVP